MRKDGRLWAWRCALVCVHSYWTSRQSPESVRALLDAGASTKGLNIPTGYAAIDELLRSQFVKNSR